MTPKINRRPLAKPTSSRFKNELTVCNSTRLVKNPSVDNGFGIVGVVWDEDNLEYAPLCVQYTKRLIGEIGFGMELLDLEADRIYGDITLEHFDFMTEYIPIDEQLTRGYIDQDFYDEWTAESCDEYEEDEQDILMGYDDRDSIERAKLMRLNDKLNPIGATSYSRMVRAFKKFVFSEV